MAIDFSFPPVETALKDPNGLLAVGGDLNVDRLIEAYALGIFPWSDDSQPLLWWSPDPRAIVYANEFHASKSLLKSMRKNNYRLTVNRAFNQVIHACAVARADTEGTWITEDMIQAYINLHTAGYAHSIEVWENKTLIGGIYGVALEPVFSGESMFHNKTDASKIAFAATCKHLQFIGWQMLDCQIANDHLTSLGAIPISRTDFRKTLSTSRLTLPSSDLWQSLNWQNTNELAREFI